MAVYYKAEIISNIRSDGYRELIGIIDRNNSFSFTSTCIFEKDHKDIENARSRISTLIKAYDKNEFSIIRDDKGFDALERLFKGKSVSYSRNIQKYVIVEVCEDKDGIKYLKEISTGRLFPALGYCVEKFDFSIYKGSVIMEAKVNLLKHSGFSAVNVVINPWRLVPASKNEVNEYLENVIKAEIIKLADDNAILDNIIITEPVEKSCLNEELSLMEEIEILLNRLKKKDQNIFKDYGELYERLKDSKSLSQLNKNMLISLKRELEYKLLTGNEIKVFLEDEINSYIEHFKNGKEIDNPLDISSLDMMTSNFLNESNKYSILEQKSILESIAGLYVFVTKENINSIAVVNASESYFNELKKSILLYIESLHKEGITDIEIDFDKNYEVDEILNLIKDMKLFENHIVLKR